MYQRIIIAISGTLLILSACSDDNNVNAPSRTIYGSGELISETRQLPEFNSIIVNTVAYVTVTQGSSQEVVVTSDDNIIEYIATPVYDGALYVSTQENVNISDFTLEVELMVTDLEAVIINSVATVEGDGNFNVDDLLFEMNSVGNIIIDLTADEVYSVNNSVGSIILSGSAYRHNIDVSSVGSVQAFELETDTTYAVSNSVGNAYVKADLYLNANINDIGSIYYRGYPVIDLVDNGSGRLIDAN